MRSPRLRDQPAQPRDQLLRIDGLDEVVVGTDQEADDAIGSFTPCAAHEHDRQLLAVALAQFAADVVPRRPRKDHVEDDCSGRKCGHELDRVLAACDVVADEAGATQSVGDELRVNGIGVNDEDIGRGLFLLLQDAPCKSIEKLLRPRRSGRVRD